MKKRYFILIFILFVSIFSLSPIVSADNNDAIAVRIVPNPNHYSISRWYESQGFKGSPQSLIVDGYQAVRDGRTVYVNATNVIPDSKAIYTNIYLISYNQDVSTDTVDILGQIISHWKFNTNIELDPNYPVGTCSISSLRCQSDNDCAEGQYCSSDPDLKVCYLTDETKNKCSTDTDCPIGMFCDSFKASIARDVDRLGKAQELKLALAKYKAVNGHYPKLSAGTYLPNSTISVWPSWNSEFLSRLSIPEKIIDPINMMGECPSPFDPITCWDKSTKKFVDPDLKLPLDSYVYVYKTDSDGSNYDLCSTLDIYTEDFQNQFGIFTFYPDTPLPAHQCAYSGTMYSGQANNSAPNLVSQSLDGAAGEEYNGFIRVIDKENNPLTWSITPVTASWPGWQSSANNNAPVLVDTNDPNQKHLYANLAGNPGTYYVNLQVVDSEGAVLNSTLPIVIKNQAPFIEAENATYILDPKIPLKYFFYYSDANITGSSYSVSLESGPDILNLNGIQETVTSAGINKRKVTYEGTIPTSFQLEENADAVYKITVVDLYGNSSTKKFTIHIIVNKPLLNFSCNNAVRLNNYYECRLGEETQGHYNITYTTSTLPPGLKLKIISDNITYQSTNNVHQSFFIRLIKRVLNRVIAQVDPQQQVIVSGVYISGIPTQLSPGYQITVTATNDYGTHNEKNFVLKINNYCGDGTKQRPNTEGKGGIYNDGYEYCDGTQGTTNNPQDSSATLQYKCSTEGETPYPILTNNFCIFASPLDGGGYCGDTYCETDYETSANCHFDCDPNCQIDCDGKECGDDGCSGTCGTCDVGETCSNGICTTECIPNCDNKECGNDGCGGSCGICANSLSCISGHCRVVQHCGNGVCSSGENACTCAVDCAREGHCCDRTVHPPKPRSGTPDSNGNCINDNNLLR